MSVDDFLQGNVLGLRAVVDLAKLQKFRAVHDEHVSRRSPDPMGAGYTYLFSPSSIGTFVTITCRCKQSEDITDYDSL